MLVCSLESKVEGLGRRVRSLELHTENATDRNIQLLAENFVELTKKLNQAIQETFCKGLFNQAHRKFTF